MYTSFLGGARFVARWGLFAEQWRGISTEGNAGMKTWTLRDSSPPCGMEIRIGRLARQICAALALACWAAGAYAAICDGILLESGAARQKEYAALVARNVDGRVKPSMVKIERLLREAGWSAAFAQVPGHENGIFFFEEIDGKKTFKQVWSGTAEHWESPFLMRWAVNLGAPERLAGCFASLVATH